MGLAKNHGVSLVEVIVILVLIGIITLLIASHITRSNTDLIAETEVIKAHLRYAQSRALNSDAIWYIRFTNNTYSLYKTGDPNPKYLPGEENPTVTLPAGMSINYGTWDEVAFDSWGKPYTSHSAGGPQVGNRIISVTDSRGSKAITITQNTGFIP